jgi:hypothetical protein
VSPQSVTANVGYSGEIVMTSMKSTFYGKSNLTKNTWVHGTLIYSPDGLTELPTSNGPEMNHNLYSDADGGVPKDSWSKRGGAES